MKKYNKYRSQLKICLTELKLTQRKLALLLGVDTSTVNRWAMEPRFADGPVPQYVWSFLLCYSLLTNEQREKLGETILLQRGQQLAA